MEIFSWELFDSQKFGNLALRLCIDFLLTFTVVKGIYAKRDRNDIFVFTFFIFNLLVFCVSYVMLTAEIGVGFGFGLFALFSILRYRTQAVKIREMTYLFTVLSLGVIHALPAQSFTLAELMIVDAAIVLALFVFENLLGNSILSTLEIRYEKIELVKPENYKALLEDLKQRTGLDIIRFRIDSTDFITDSAMITIYFRHDAHIFRS